MKLERPNGNKATLPCPCGWRLSRQRDCRCDPGEVSRYFGRISGPLLDRVDLHVAVTGVAWRDLERAPEGGATHGLRELVTSARARQARPYRAEQEHGT